MTAENIRSVQATVSPLPRGEARTRRLARAAEARRRLERPRRRRPIGRAWINGREVGGTADPLAHLTLAHD
jgi:hypothetical protein